MSSSDNPVSGRAALDRNPPSSDPTSERILDALKPFMASICGPLPESGSNRVRFGHIKIPPYRLREPSLLEMIATAIPSTGYASDLRPFFVLSDFERSVITEEVQTELNKRTLPPAIATFAEVLQALRGSRCSDGSAHVCWMPYNSPMGWEKGRLIPRKAVIVIQLDPQLSADCALALIGLVQWAFDICVNSHTSLHILTMSTDPGYNIVPALAERRYPGIAISELNLAALADQDPLAAAQVIEDQDIASKIDEAMLQGPKCSIAVVMIGDLSVGQFLPESAGAQTILRDATRMPQFNKFCYRQEGLPSIWILDLNGNCPLLPTALEGYDEVHVVLGSNYEDVAWHHGVGQLALFRRVTARDERRDQLWWARQPNAKATYVYTSGSSIEAFLEAGYSRHRLIEDAHLGGFIASVFDMRSWGIDAERVVRLCVRAPALHVTMEMLDRLRVQRIISQDRVILPDLDAKVFRAILPMVNYDHRLALFVALDSESPNSLVKMVKVQLAALATFGLERLFSGKPLEKTLTEVAFADEQLLSLPFEACMGYGSRLATRGTLWLSLGLWKHFLSVESAPDNTRFKALHDLIAMNREVAQLAEERVTEMCRALQAQGIRISPAMRVSDEKTNIDEDDTSQLEAHLLRSFLHQLVGVYSPRASSKLTFKLVATDAQVHQIGHDGSITGLLPIYQMYEEGPVDCLFGVCSLLRKGSGKPTILACDWTMISASTVSKWRDEIAQGTGNDDAGNGI